MRNTILIGLSVVSLTLLSFSLNKPKKGSAKQAMKTLDGFCNYVPSGYAVVEGDTMSVQAFYISTTEISNIQYAEFLFDLKKNNETEKLKVAMVDSTRWTEDFKQAFNEPMEQYYHSHPAYHNYPVVNISKEAAELYCAWLTEQYEKLSGGELKLKFRIPTHAEWMRAARGSNHHSVYTWNTSSLTNEKGEFLANFSSLGAENITRDESGELKITFANSSGNRDGAFYTSTVMSYAPNDFGLYNMNGNVSEMISDSDHAVGGDWFSPGFDVRNESKKAFTSAHPTVGFRIVATVVKAN